MRTFVCAISLSCILSASIWAQNRLPESILTPQVPTDRPFPPAKSFDADRLEIKIHAGKHVLAAGNIPLKDFGPFGAEAQQALRLLTDWRVNRRFVIPYSQPAIEVWTTEGEVPTRPPYQRQAITFDPETLRVEKLLGQYCLRDAKNVICQFGDEQEAAKDALFWLKKLGVNAIGFIGAPNPVMSYVFFDRFQPKSSKQDNHNPLSLVHHLQSQGLMVPKLGLVGQRYRIQPRQLQVRQTGNVTELGYGNLTFGSFGRDEFAARDALRFFEDQRIDEVTRLAGQQIFFSRGQPLRHMPLNAKITRMDLSKIVIDKDADAVFLLKEGNRPLLRLTGTKNETDQFLEVLKTFRLDGIAQLGNPLSGGMQFLFRAGP